MAFDGHEVGRLDRADFGDPSKVVPGHIHDHQVFRDRLGITDQRIARSFVGAPVFDGRGGPLHRPHRHLGSAALKKQFRGKARDLPIAPLDVGREGRSLNSATGAKELKGIARWREALSEREVDLIAFTLGERLPNSAEAMRVLVEVHLARKSAQLRHAEGRSQLRVKRRGLVVQRKPGEHRPIGIKRDEVGVHGPARFVGQEPGGKSACGGVTLGLSQHGENVVQPHGAHDAGGIPEVNPARAAVFTGAPGDEAAKGQFVRLKEVRVTGAVPTFEFWFEANHRVAIVKDGEPWVQERRRDSTGPSEWVAPWDVLVQ